MKMMDIDSEHLGIPEQDYSVVISMPSSEFQKTCKDLSMFSDSLNITATKSGVTFSGKGDTGSSVVQYSNSSSADDEKVRRSAFYYLSDEMCNFYIPGGDQHNCEGASECKLLNQVHESVHEGIFDL